LVLTQAEPWQGGECEDSEGCLLGVAADSRKKDKQMEYLSKADPALDHVYGGGDTGTTTTANTNTCNGAIVTVKIDVGPVGISYTKCTPVAPSGGASGPSTGASGPVAPPPKSSDDNEDSKVRH